MVPIILDAARLDLMLVGRGHELAKRLAWLRAGGAERLRVHSDDPAALAAMPAEAQVIARLPGEAEIAAASVIWITGMSEAEGAALAATARRLGRLVNVEDVMALCDFHTPAVVRRGDLLMSVSTGGRSPGLAQRVKGWLESQFGAEWAERLDLVAAKRNAWRRRERSLAELASLTNATIDRRGWLGDEGVTP